MQSDEQWTIMDNHGQSLSIDQNIIKMTSLYVHSELIQSKNMLRKIQ